MNHLIILWYTLNAHKIYVADMAENCDSNDILFLRYWEASFFLNGKKETLNPGL